MTIKVLEPPLRKGDSFIIAVNGNLRVIDPKSRCHGYANCCVCKGCAERELRLIEDTQPATCECERPTIFSSSPRCHGCGKPTAKPQLVEAA